MPDVFLSYAQKDRARAEQVAERLRALGWDVWWDVHVYVGAKFRAEIARQLETAKCVVVLWSRASLDSDWVIDEAEEGKKRGVLVQALIEDVQPPHGFRGLQWANLSDWEGDNAAPSFVRLSDGIARRVPPAASVVAADSAKLRDSDVGPPPAPSFERLHSQVDGSVIALRIRTRWGLYAAGLLVVALVTVGITVMLRPGAVREGSQQSTRQTVEPSSSKQTVAPSSRNEALKQPSTGEAQVDRTRLTVDGLELGKSLPKGSDKQSATPSGLNAPAAVESALPNGSQSDGGRTNDAHTASPISVKCDVLQTLRRADIQSTPVEMVLSDVESGTPLTFTSTQRGRWPRGGYAPRSAARCRLSAPLHQVSWNVRVTHKHRKGGLSVFELPVVVKQFDGNVFAGDLQEFYIRNLSSQTAYVTFSQTMKTSQGDIQLQNKVDSLSLAATPQNPG